MKKRLEQWQFRLVEAEKIERQLSLLKPKIEEVQDDTSSMMSYDDLSEDSSEEDDVPD